MILSLAMAQQGIAKETVSPGIAMGSPWSVAWVDVNGDGRSDYCYLYGTDAERIRCFFAGAEGQFAATPDIDTVIGGTGGSLIWWADIDGDGQTDVCRADLASYFGRTSYYASPTHTLWCRLARNKFAGANVITYVPEAYSDPESGNSWGGVGNMNEVFFADVDGDQKSDMCFAYHDPAQGSALATLRCHLSTGTGFGGPNAAWTSAVLNPGNADYPRTFADVNGDGAADFCRTLDNGTLRCLLGSESGFTATDLASAPIDRGYKEGAAFIDANGDGKTDYCRITGSSGSYRLRCTYSTGVGWDTANERVSPVIPNDKVGHAAARWWIDINADGLPDFCRAVGTDPNSGDGNSDVQSTLSCRLNKGDGSSSDAVGAFYYSDIELNANFGRRFGPRQWCDPSGSGFPTLCRNSYTVVYGTNCDEVSCPVLSETSALVTGLGTNDSAQANHPLLTAYTDGLGAETRIGYLPLTSAEVYTRSGFANTQRRFVGPPPASPVVYETRAWMVGSAEAGSGLTLTGNARYFYRDLTNDPWAGNSRGFRERWMFSEGTNTIDHTVFFQGLGPTVDGSGSIENDPREIGMVKTQQRYAIDGGVTPVPGSTDGGKSQRYGLLLTLTGQAMKLTSIDPSGLVGQPTPFLLMQQTDNVLGDTSPPNPRYRFISKSTVSSYDHNGSSLVPLPTAATTTQQDNFGNVTRIEQAKTQNAASGTLTWSSVTENTYDGDPKWRRLGRLKKSTVTSSAPSLDAQIAASARSAGTSANASAVSSSLPAVGQEAPKPLPLPPQLLMPILQLLLED